MSLLSYLTNFRIVRILLPIQEGAPLPLECVAHVTEEPFFEADFLEGQLPVATLDREGQCRIIFEIDGHAHSVTARIEKVVDDNKLSLQAIQISGFAQKREYFRVDTEFSLVFRRLREGLSAPENTFQGRGNLSGSGIFFAVPEEIQLKEKLALELHLRPESGESVSAIGQVVRAMRLGRDKTGLGIQFVDIEAPARDKIISFCLAEQRRLLQTRVRIIDQA